MAAPVLPVSPSVFERLDAYQRERGLSWDAALLELLEQAQSNWLERQLAGVPEDDEEVSPATRDRIEAARRSLEQEGGIPSEHAGR